MARALTRNGSVQIADINKLFTPLFEHGVGFDRLFDSMTRALHNTPESSSYPPYNIVEVAENTYQISLALAGFRPEDLDLQWDNGVLTITGKTAETSSDADKRRYLHRGIANRKFIRRFNLAEHIRVTDAKMEHGILTVDLVRELPEALKPRTIEIKAG